MLCSFITQHLTLVLLVVQIVSDEKRYKKLIVGVEILFLSQENKHLKLEL